MMIHLSELINLWGSPAQAGFKKPTSTFGPIFTDSRKVQPGGFFVPLIGQNFDGHQFLQQAYDRGAKAAVVSFGSSIPIPEGFSLDSDIFTASIFDSKADLHIAH